LRRLGLGGAVALRVLSVRRRPLAQALVLLEQARLRREVFADAHGDIDRRRGGALQRVCREREPATQTFHVTKTCVDYQQCERERGKEEKPDERRRSALEEWRGGMV